MLFASAGSVSVQHINESGWYHEIAVLKTFSTRVSFRNGFRHLYDIRSWTIAWLTNNWLRVEIIIIIEIL